MKHLKQIFFAGILFVGFSLTASAQDKDKKPPPKKDPPIIVVEKDKKPKEDKPKEPKKPEGLNSISDE